MLKHEQDQLHYADIFSETNKVAAKFSTHDIIKDYFNLPTKLSDLYLQWSEKDPHFKKIASAEFHGIRILRQDPWENLCCFICSTNNNIKRISQMVENLCLHFGDYISEYDGIKYYDFPSPMQLADPSVEIKLRQLGFGYRAKYIQKTAQMISEHPEGTLSLVRLREVSYQDAHKALLQYVGVGPKVADCVCLMSLDKHDCVPVDTHVWQIAQRDYKFGRNYKTLTKTAYEAVGDFFRNTWGEYAGWAHSVLFTADLRDLNNGQNKNTPKTPETKAPTKSNKRDRSKLENEKRKVLKLEVTDVYMKLETSDVKSEITTKKLQVVTESKKPISLLDKELVQESVSERLKRRKRIKV